MIQFDPTVFATPQTITLTNTLELYNPNVPEVIDGPGASLAAISGNNAVVVFNAGGDAATIAGLTIEDGSNPGLDGIGGGIESGGTVTVNDCTFANNDAGDFGGGIGNNGTLIGERLHLLAKLGPRPRRRHRQHQRRGDGHRQHHLG